MKLSLKINLVIAFVFAILLTSSAAYTENNRARADVNVVLSLYQAFAAEAVLESPAAGKRFVDQPRSVLSRYFTPLLATLLVKDRECTVRTGEICNLDFSPIWDAQDVLGATVKIMGEAALGKVSVTVRYASGEKRRLIFQLIKMHDGWRIADIVYADERYSLMQILK